jgi:hypothetical protein
MWNRRFRHQGISPVLAYVVLLLAFAGTWFYLYQRFNYAPYLVILLFSAACLRLSNQNRTDFLKLTYGDATARQIRLLEHLLIGLPFLGVLTFYGNFWECLLLLGIGAVLALMSFTPNTSWVLPTPFSKYPFEFTVGFRKTVFVFPVAYVLAIIAIQVGNVNLGIFSFLLLFLITLSFYIWPEPDYVVWVHAQNPTSFLWKKIKVASWSSLLIVSPIVIGLIVFFPASAGLILLFALGGLVFLWAIILAKYGAYPYEMSLPEGVMFALSLYFPPLLFAVIPYFFFLSIQKLKRYLHD